MPADWGVPRLVRRAVYCERTSDEPAPFVLRPATATDAAAIEAIERASFDRPAERFSLRQILHLIRTPRARVTVAEANGQVLGWAAALFWRRHGQPVGRLYAIASDPRARGRGIGRELAKDAIAELFRRGAARVYLEVRSDNAAALNLYRKMGFRECQTLPDYYGPGVGALRLARDRPDTLNAEAMPK